MQDDPRSKISALYDRTHGVRWTEIVPDSMPPDPQERLQFWETFWRELGFDGPSPTGSSRLMEVALAQSRAGNPSDLVRALFNVLGDAPYASDAAAYFALLIWRTAIGDPATFDAVRGCLRPLPTTMTPAQAMLARQFANGGSPS